MSVTEELENLSKNVDGELIISESIRKIYATDASAYRELPLGVLIAKNKSDIIKAIDFVRANNTTLIPRTAGTSLSGQVVGNGLVVDCSKYMTGILELNTQEKWVRVEPGVVLDELNLYLKDFGLFFGPETSTSNRCMLGGMVGNNSCGAHSLVYGSTRDHTLEIKAILSDGKEVVFKDISTDEFNKKCTLEGVEGQIYKFFQKNLSGSKIRKQIEN
ncbi:MAG: FAD-binding oxidoreductase, partial [Bacteroidales bacterium]|nr:FAD-binding oxidoreductase [Bacteroidales bacterium]